MVTLNSFKTPHFTSHEEASSSLEDEEFPFLEFQICSRFLKSP
jgi:hypothetical protein